MPIQLNLISLKSVPFLPRFASAREEAQKAPSPPRPGRGDIRRVALYILSFGRRRRRPRPDLTSPMTADPDIRRKRLVFQSTHRGSKENDLLLGDYAKRRLAALTEDQVDKFEKLLDEDDKLLFDIIVGNEKPPERLDHDVMAAIIAFNADRRTNVQ